MELKKVRMYYNDSTWVVFEYQDKKDTGYNISYMGINLGAFIAPFVASYLRNNYGLGYAFAAAGIGMFLGVIISWLGNKNYKEADVRKPAAANDISLTRIFSMVILPAIVAGILGWVLIPGDIFGSNSTDAFIFGAIPIMVFYGSLWARASAEDKRPIAALLSIFAVVIVFWAIFKQNGITLTTWAE